MIGWNTIGNFLNQWYLVKWWREFCAETLKKVFSNEKKWLQERSSGTSSTRIFSCLHYKLIIIRFFEFNLELICTCEFFKKLKLHKPLWPVQFQLFENCTRQSGSCNFSFLKNSLMQINSKLNSKPYDYLYLFTCLSLDRHENNRSHTQIKNLNFVTIFLRRK